MGRRIVAMLMLLVWLPTAVLAQAPVPAAPPPPASAPADRDLPLVAGLGAIAGVVGFNLLALGLQALPGGLGYGVGAVVAAEMSVAMSRVYAVGSAVAGGLAAHWLYDRWQADLSGAVDTVTAWLPVDPMLLATGIGAIAGVVAFNIVAASVATVPLAGGVLAAVPTEIALGSRVLAGLSVVAGSLGATAAYDWITGHASDYGRAAVLAGGALGGIVTGNLLSGWLGSVPYYPGAGQAVGAAASGFASASAQAASRVYVVTFGVVGAWAADWAWRAQSLPPMPAGPR